MTDELRAAAAEVIECCRERGLTVATAESCTGGLVAAWLTDIPGSSAVFDRGFVTYSNEAKEAMLGVPRAVLEACGAVSAETAAAMAAGALAHSRADLAVAVTGVAGPGGGTADKPVGMVAFAAKAREGRCARCDQRFGDIGREAVRQQAVLVALALLRSLALSEDQS
jgi:nicotinamide-nucleotide amidase